jgi:outer membrane phospholipase A
MRRFSTRLVLIPVLISATTASFAQAVSTLISPREPVSAGSVIVIEWMTLNPSHAALLPSAPADASGTLYYDGQTAPITLRATSTSPSVIPPGGFAVRRYDLQLPPDLAGMLVLEIAQEGAAPLRTALDVRRDVPPSTTQEDSRLSSLGNTSEAAPTIVRTFAGRLSPHEPIYFIYGADDPAAKFQFSFKYRLLTLGEGSERFSPPTVQFGFTQRSLWDIGDESSPFYDTSYIPEIMYESLAPRTGETEGWLNFLGYQLGYRHESNGRDGAVSRSLNTVYLRGAFGIGRLDGWHWLIIPEVFGYVGDLSNNPRIKEYRGYGQLRVVFGTNDGPSLMTAVWTDKDFDRVSYQLDLSIPVKTRLLDFETYLTAQYFHGYGESLLSYETMTETIRAGISFVR